MAPIKRKAHKSEYVTNLSRMKSFKVPTVPQVPEYATVATQTDAIKLNTLDNMQQSKRFSRPKSAFVTQRKWAEEKDEPISAEQDRLNTRNKSCQTIKVGIKTNGPMRQMSSLKDIMLRRRRLSDVSDRARLKKLMDTINGDPPPNWHDASAIWLDVEVLEKRIEEFEKEETEMQRELEMQRDEERR
ncbi:hypothetical protein KR044_012413, partial [Drosophila immigrans]